jgi:sugar phosphate isomerase/epimerase
MRCVDLAAELEADCVSFWSGAPDDSGAHDAWTRLTQGVRALVRYADGRGVRLAFEPEPGMFIDTFAQFERLLNALHGAPLGLACDVGHVHCLEEGPVSEHLVRWSERIVTMHVEDMRRGVHDHLPFGAGEVDFDDLFRALAAIDYRGSLNVELSRHSHAAAEMVRRSWQFLDGLRARFGPPRPAR